MAFKVSAIFEGPIVLVLLTTYTYKKEVVKCIRKKFWD
jgi:hypothetical protein